MRVSTVYSKTVTAADDNAFQIENDPLNVITGCNIHCYSQDAYYGNLTLQASVIAANAVVWFDKPIRVSDLWFKNKTAGQNTQIVITGVLG